MCGILDPHLARPIDEDFGHRVAIEPLPERREIGVEIDAALARDGLQRLALARLEGVDIRAHLLAQLSLLA